MFVRVRLDALVCVCVHVCVRVCVRSRARVLRSEVDCGGRPRLAAAGTVGRSWVRGGLLAVVDMSHVCIQVRLVSGGKRAVATPVRLLPRVCAHVVAQVVGPVELAATDQTQPALRGAPPSGGPPTRGGPFEPLIN